MKGKWEKGKTIWLDEITDNQDRVALIVGRFHLDHWLDGSLIKTLYAGQGKNTIQQFKEPSPARIMRVWRTTQDFWKESVSSLLAQRYSNTSDRRFQRQNVRIAWQGFGPDKGSVLDGTISASPISFFVLEDGSCLTIINYKLHQLHFQIGMQISVSDEQGREFSGSISEVLAPPLERATYQPTRTILTTPDQFLALVPGEDALGLAQQIADQHACEMGKVRSRLPLDLSLIYFHRKMPLYAVIDAARRFLEAKPRTEEKWTVKKVTPDAATLVTKIEFEDGIDWSISTGFGDGKTEDNFYPYVALADEKILKGDRHYYVDKDKPEQKLYTHISDLADNAPILVAPSHFSYLWLDNSTRRYSVGIPEKDAPFATQGMYLEEIEQLTKMWNDIKAAKITDTKLHGVIELLLAKYEAWCKPGQPVAEKQMAECTIVAFAEDVLRRSNLHSIVFGKTAPTTPGGKLHNIQHLFRCFDVHHRIMKQSLAN